MFMKVYKLGEQTPLFTFPQGTHNLGRGDALQCTDKRVSRIHATLVVSEDEIKLTSVHLNPTFVRVANSKTLTILKKDSSVVLNDGDTFAFLPDNSWFRIQTVDQADPQIPKTETEHAEHGTKRHVNSLDDTIPQKRIKGEEDSVGTTTDSLNGLQEVSNTSLAISDSVAAKEKEEGLSAHVKGETSPQSDSKGGEKTDVVPQNVDATSSHQEDASKESHQEHTSKESHQEDASNEQTDPNNATVNDLGQDQQQNNEGEPGTSAGSSTINPRRERCWYGAKCYRQNPVHHNEYTHPGDSDYESDPNDNRPTCSFGAGCYRKNKDHRRNYKHPSNQPPSKQKRQRKKVKRLNAADSEEMKELDFSESDEDPFINDDDSDEYSANSVSDDSDWEPSQDRDEDSENIQRLVKEAKRFVKK